MDGDSTTPPTEHLGELEAELLKGLASGPPREMSDDDWRALEREVSPSK